MVVVKLFIGWDNFENIVCEMWESEKPRFNSKGHLASASADAEVGA